ncbi:aminotransferase class III-fold pyridoxal phosphate-dependent enzyme [Methylophaga sulfidovorans]|uniref:Aminotransferase class-III n=1 Tax=Methylophaga sulfidovorans TaxID=45496 RepID=A0A1I3XVQ0_9GAMM|nr:aminotransferase class III-fold pyridoxal phosphate-dependent enzyme [Methylophaga sulfidovorans]SFK23604.1 Aminotransferase class-III [Methylophaga sulfidovorans]
MPLLPAEVSQYASKLTGFKHVPFNDINAVLAAINKNTVAVMLEPIQGEAGVIAADQAFLRQLREMTKKQDLLLIVDEVQTGMGRTGQLFAHQHAGIQADVMTLGKGLGGGFPLSALLVTDQVACFDLGDQGGTYNGNPLASAVGLAVLTELTRPGFMDAVNEKSQQLRHALETLQQQDRYGLIKSVRGQGLLQAICFHRPIAKALVKRAFEAGLLINAAQADVIRFMQSLLVTEDEIKLMADIMLQQVLNR